MIIVASDSFRGEIVAHASSAHRRIYHIGPAKQCILAHRMTYATMWVRIGRLRRKFKDNAEAPRIIKMVRNSGYIFVAKVTRL
jgi:hypothetical protein